MTSSTNNKPLRNGGNSAPSIIGSDVKIEGNITTVGEIQLDGVVEGDINCGSMTMGEHGAVTGVIAADSLIVRGKVDGTVRARSIRLEKSARVTGDVWHETLSVEAGAYIEGRFVHSDSAGKGASRAAKAENVLDATVLPEKRPAKIAANNS